MFAQNKLPHWFGLALLVFLALELSLRGVSAMLAWREARMMRRPIPLAALRNYGGPLARTLDRAADPARTQELLSDVLRLKYRHFPDYDLLDPRFSYLALASNAIGFRGPAWRCPKPAKEFRIFLLGGSTAFSLYAMEAEALHSQLQQLLSRRGGTLGYDFRVYCAAIPGATSKAEAAIARDFIANHAPDAIIALDGFNDAAAALELRPRGLLARLEALYRRPLVRNLMLLQVPAAFISRTIRQLARTGRLPRSMRRDTPTAAAVGQEYVANLEKISRWAAVAHVRFLVCLQPNLLALPPVAGDSSAAAALAWWNRRSPGAQGFHSAAYRAMREALTASTLPWLEAARLFEPVAAGASNRSAAAGGARPDSTATRAGSGRGAERRAGPDEVFIDVVHFTPGANALLAQYLCAWLLKSLETDPVRENQTRN